MKKNYYCNHFFARLQGGFCRALRRNTTAASRDASRFLTAAECSLDDFYIFDGVPDASGTIVDFRFSYINPNAERRLGVPRESLQGKLLTEVRPFAIQSGLIHKYCEVVRSGIPYTCEIYIDDEMIQDTWLNVQVVRLGTGIAITSRDVTEHRRRADHVHYLAHHDHLTGLANRVLLHKRLRKAIAHAQKHDERVAVFLVDIDYFKQINDTHGHAFGDALLAIVGERLLSAVRESDNEARMGGEEFVVVMQKFRTMRDVERCGEEKLRMGGRPIEGKGEKMNRKRSIVCARVPEGGCTVEELFRNADIAMYTVKDSGRNSLCIFDASLSVQQSVTA